MFHFSVSSEDSPPLSEIPCAWLALLLLVILFSSNTLHKSRPLLFPAQWLELWLCLFSAVPSLLYSFIFNPPEIPISYSKLNS